MPGQKRNPAAGVKQPLGLYLHIPFCRQKCRYCDFLSAPASAAQIDRYVEALGAQLSEDAADYADFYVRSVFFGGGTPSLLSAAQVEWLMDQIRRCYDLPEDAEVTIESNPGTLDLGKLCGYRAAGINRLSIGLQSADDMELKVLGRIHNFQTFSDNYEAARKAGFTNINVDLMSALPGQTFSGWMNTLQKVAELKPEHISAYSLIIEEGTPFFDIYGKTEAGMMPCASDSGCGGGGKEKKSWPALPCEEEERLMYERTAEFLEQRGYHRYEISNYAASGRECLHNTGYWNRTAYAGFGLGAASMVNQVRWKITSDLEKYLLCYGRGKTGKEACREEVQVLSCAEQMEEFMFLGLRLTAGIRLAAFREQFQKGLREVYGPVLQKLEEQGLILFYEDGKRLKLTSRGIDLSNYVLAQFLFERI